MKKNQILVAGVSHRFTTQVTANNQGIAGQDVLFNLQRLSDNKWWNGASWGVPQIDLTCTETGSTYPGEYYYDIAGSEIGDGIIYIEQFKILSGLYIFNSVDRLFGEYDINKLALYYDFATYTKAVILWYDIDRPFGATDPIYWTYAYTAAGGKPTNSAQIALKDRIIRWIDAQPV